ncbi:hypothetical protein LNV08_15545 [Paucibacter sp. TC2R-5]|uniref:hypothetical protein n=1 Tax=Paucibacter sp. TC2R-5 TaxID=2893555 RepID=UPI0021E4A9C1|nr:hypothetical protein [Paucibacter sp. TC2R-5]MCV2360390.1 hypothetical protein [Paucibacter sp. TC2R-5]
MKIEAHTHFAENYKSMATAAEVALALAATPLAAVQVLMCADLQAEVAKYTGLGFLQIGSAQFVGRGGQGVGREAREQATKVGAALVLFTLVPCKLRAVRKTADGQIDMQAVRADPPSSLSPKGYSVITSAFLAKQSE